VSGSGISWSVCKSAPSSRQTTMPAPHHSVFLTGRMPFLPPNQQCQSIEGMRKMWQSAKYAANHIKLSCLTVWLVAAITLYFLFIVLWSVQVESGRTAIQRVGWVGIRQQLWQKRLEYVRQIYTQQTHAQLYWYQYHCTCVPKYVHLFIFSITRPKTNRFL